MQIAPSPARINRAFDLTTIENAREAYFLPGIDRLAASVAEKATTPVDVHVDINGQSLDYTLPPGSGDAVIPTNVNGQNVEIRREGDAYKAEGPVIGKLDATFEPIENGSKIGGLVGTEDMAFTESIQFNTPNGFYAELGGNFACSRMWQEVEHKGEGLKVSGALGSHWISSEITVGANGALVIEGSLGEVDFRQTITPRA